MYQEVVSELEIHGKNYVISELQKEGWPLVVAQKLVEEIIEHELVDYSEIQRGQRFMVDGSVFVKISNTENIGVQFGYIHRFKDNDLVRLVPFEHEV